MVSDEDRLGLSGERWTVAGEPLLSVDTDRPSVLLGEHDDGVVEARAPRRPSRRRRYVRRVMVVLVVVLIPVVYSYGRALTGPGNDSLQARSVEWAREHHLGGVVDRVEKYYYANHQAKVGGTPDSAADQLKLQTGAADGASASGTTVADPQAGAGPGTTAAGSAMTGSANVSLPNVADAQTTTGQLPESGKSGAPVNPPPPLISPVTSPVAGEGNWRGLGPQISGRYGAYATLIRPDAVHTSVLDAVIWVDPRLLSLRQYPGQKIPGAPWDRPDFVEPQRQRSLVAAFSGGFRLQDSHGGMFLGGTELRPLRKGGATLVIDQHGVPNIGMWGRDFTATDGLDSARQNLDLIVDNGAVAPRLTTDLNRTWGFTGPANRDAVWRSGAGVTAEGAFVWVGGDGLSISALAETLVRAGAVRGMQLDINREWVQFNTYSTDGTGVVHGRRLLTGMEHSDDRYLSEDTRDFLAILQK